MERAADNSIKKTLINGMRASLRRIVLPCILGIGLQGVRSADAQIAAAEYRVEAAFVFHFAQLVDWPSDALSVPTESFNVCLFDDEPYRQEFQPTLEGKPIGRLTMHVRLLDRSQGAENCRILFLSRNENRRQAELIRTLRGLPVLTIGDADGFLTEGGMIRFQLERDKIRFDINLATAETSHLKISSRLLLLATSVHNNGTGGGR